MKTLNGAIGVIAREIRLLPSDFMIRRALPTDLAGFPSPIIACLRGWMLS
jgi:hypothetical protein